MYLKHERPGIILRSLIIGLTLPVVSWCHLLGSRVVSGFLWSDEVQVNIKFSSHNLILATFVNIATSIEFVLVCVYRDPHHRQTRAIWNQIAIFVCENVDKPVVCFGDLNNIMCDVDTTSSNINKHRMRAFNSYVKQCGLFDLGFSGPAAFFLHSGV